MMWRLAEATFRNIYLGVYTVDSSQWRKPEGMYSRDLSFIIVIKYTPL